MLIGIRLLIAIFDKKSCHILQYHDKLSYIAIFTVPQGEWEENPRLQAKTSVRLYLDSQDSRETISVFSLGPLTLWTLKSSASA
jgi:hypothetical protein